MAESQQRPHPLIPNVHVIFDTSSIYAKDDKEIVGYPVREMVAIARQNIRVKWYLPYAVRRERQYQILQKLEVLAASARKLHKILNIAADIDSASLKQQVERLVIIGMQSVGLEELRLDSRSVDWEPVIDNALDRIPPFSSGDNKEKGFRDAVIIETFVQFANNVAAFPGKSICVFVCADKMQRKVARDRSAAMGHVRVIEDVQLLGSLLSTFDSGIDESTIEEYRKKAAKYFFRKGKTSTLMYKRQVIRQTREQFVAQLKKSPRPDVYRKHIDFAISEPAFIKQDGARLFWETRIHARAEARYRSQSDPLAPLSSTYLSGSVLGNNYWTIPTSGGPLYTTDPTRIGLRSDLLGKPGVSGLYGSNSGRITGSLYGGSVPDQNPYSSRPNPYTIGHIDLKADLLAGFGSSVFKVIWSAVVSSANRFTAGQIVDIEYIDDEWEFGYDLLD